MSGQEALISVIVPVYQAERHLRACLESIVSQSLEDWECILVDDGSRDSSPAICDEFAARDARFRVYHRENGGVSVARNFGLDMARGRYVAFIDADDVLLPMHFAALYGLIADHGADAACTDLLRISSAQLDQGNLPAPSEASKPLVLTGLEAAQDILYQKHMEGSVSDKLFLRSAWESVRFPEGIRYEDLAMTTEIYPRLQRVVYQPLRTYLYRQSEDSFIHSFDLRRADVLGVTDGMLECARQKWPALTAAATSRRMSAHFNILGLIKANRADYPDLEKRCCEVIRQGRWKSLTDRQVRLRNKVAAALSYLGMPLLSFFLKIKYKRSQA